MTNAPDRKFYILSGCSGGGKSSLLGEMQKRGYSIIPEAGRRVVANAQKNDTDALPWKSPNAFVRACVELHLRDLASSSVLTGPVLLDRSLIDVISYLEFKFLPVPQDLANLLKTPRYESLVFITPPWPEVFENDGQRKVSFSEAVLEHEHLCQTFSRLGFTLQEVPQHPLPDRADFIEQVLTVAS